MLMKVFVLLLFLFVTQMLNAQKDTLVFRSGEKLAGTFLEIDHRQVRVVLQKEETEGIERMIDLSQLQRLIYRTGATQEFAQELTFDSLSRKELGKDANYDYKQGYWAGMVGYQNKGPGTAALLLGITGVGIIPAIIMAQVPPNDYHFNRLDDKILYTNTPYMKGYQHAAFKTKKRKIIHNFTFGFLVGSAGFMILKLR
jgi:hypothetical protein